MIKVSKFGGTSMADGNTIRRVAAILASDPSRRYVVVSAPGKRYSGDTKITDLLYASLSEAEETGRVGENFQKVCDRFRGIVRELGLSIDLEALLASAKECIERERTADAAASRGEFLAGHIMAAYLKIPFIDAAEVVRFREGRLDGDTTYALLRAALKGKRRAVVAGFYGADEKGRICTFSRGGSDVSGALVARAAGADLYENWTDVSGFLACDPRIVPSPEGIRELSYKELRELSYMGANVLHSESIFPVREADIPILIKNTFRPEDEGTRIVPTARLKGNSRTVTGIAGKKNFTVIFLEKSLMNAELGFAHSVLAILKRHGINFEHMPTGIDTISFVIDSAELAHGMRETVVEEIKAAVRPDRIAVFSDVALIAVVGHGMSKNIGTSARLFSAIARAGVNVRMIDQGSSELNIIVGVDNENYERTLRAVYDEFFGASGQKMLED